MRISRRSNPLFSMITRGLFTLSLAIAGPRCLGAGTPQGRNASSRWRLATEDTQIVVSVENGRPVLKVLSSKTSGHNWLSAPLKENLMERVEVSGVPVSTNWKFEGGALDSKGEQLILSYSNSSPRLMLQSIWRARPGRSPVQHLLTIANQSESVITVTHEDSLVSDGLT